MVMARRSQDKGAMLCALPLAALLTSGCIIPEAPEYGAPRQTPVFIDDGSINPNPRSLLHLTNTDGNSVQFKVTVRSEDAGDDLISALYSDYKHDSGLLLYDDSYKPETFDDERPISYQLRFRDSRFGDGPECHAFTLLLLHAQGWDFDHRQPKGAPSDLASVTWFASFNDDGGGLVSSCPSAATESSEPDRNTP